MSGAVEVAMGGLSGCARSGAGSVWCWGRNDKGQLGDGSTTDSSLPVQVVGVGGTGTLTGAVLPFGHRCTGGVVVDVDATVQTLPQQACDVEVGDAVLAFFAIVAGWKIPFTDLGIVPLLEQARPLGTAEGAAGGQLLHHERIRWWFDASLGYHVHHGHRLQWAEPGGAGWALLRSAYRPEPQPYAARERRGNQK